MASEGEGVHQGMPAYTELVEIFGEGLLPHTMPTSIATTNPDDDPSLVWSFATKARHGPGRKKHGGPAQRTRQAGSIGGVTL